MTAVALEREVGHSDKPVREMLREMEEAGLVAHHGRARGWTMTQLGWLKLHRWIEAGRPTGNWENFRPADADQVRSDSDLRSESDLIEDRYTYQSDLIRSDLMETSRKNDGGSRPEDEDLLVEGAAKNGNGPGEREVLRTFLNLIEIDGQAFSEILVRDRLVDVVAWYWFTLGKPNIQKPSGWVVACLRNETKPKPAYLEFAHAWLAMSAEDYEDYLEAKTSPNGATYYWEEQEVSSEVVEVFNRVKRHGGLEFIDDYDRPILADEAEEKAS